jgi:hypothetical protein
VELYNRADHWRIARNSTVGNYMLTSVVTFSSFFNFAAHWHGMSRIQESIPAWHSLRPYYMMFGYGMAIFRGIVQSG